MTIRPLNTAAALALARDLAEHAERGDCSLPEKLQAEVDALDGVTRTRIEWYVRGRCDQRTAAVLSPPLPFPQESDANSHVAPNCWRQLADEERVKRQGAIAFAAIAFVVMAFAIAYAKVQNDRAINDLRMERAK